MKFPSPTHLALLLLLLIATPGKGQDPSSRHDSLPKAPLAIDTAAARRFAASMAEVLEQKPTPLRYRERCTSIGIGSANVFDTYLSPDAYSGIELRVLHESMTDPVLSDRHWLQQTLFQTFASYTDHPSNDNHNFLLHAEWRWGYLYRLPLRPTPNMQFLVGGQFYGEGGMIYNLANGNNPVAAKLALGAGLTAVMHSRFHIRGIRRPFALRYQFFLPCMGAFFAPHYGQSYYEMFSLGHRDGIVSFSSFHNKPSHWHNLTLDVPLLKKTTLRLGYLIDIRQTSQHELKYHNWSHNFTLGLVHKFIKL